MIDAVRGLSERELKALADLERRCLAVDGGRLKLEWEALRHRVGDAADDVLAWDGDELVGFCGIYSHGSPPELAGMVDPAHRGRGIGGALLDAALAECAARGARVALLVVPRSSAAGRALALARGGRAEHSEHTLELNSAPALPPAMPGSGPDVQLRPASDDDLTDLRQLLASGFGPVSGEVHADRRTLVVAADGRTVGTLRLSREGEAAAIHGFVVDEALRGRGIGRRVLALACRSAFDEGAASVFLEVATDNDHALGLYTSLGFVRTSTEDYYELATSVPPTPVRR